MAFTPEAPPVRSGDYTRFVTKPVSTIPVGTGGTVALAFVDDTGPANVPTLYTSWQDYLDRNGAPLDSTNPSEGFLAVYNAFKGGAGAVLGVRQAGSSLAVADATVAAGVGGFTLEALYEGTKGNAIAYEVVANIANPATQRDFRLFYNGVLVVERLGVGANDILSLVDTLNRQAKKYIKPITDAENGTVLDAQALTNLSGGDDGATLTAGDYTALRGLLEPQKFGYFGFANLTDASVKAAMQAWAEGLNNADKPKRFFIGFGGAGAETYAEASGESTGWDNENTIRLALGTYRDTNLDVVLTSAQLLPRLLGAASALGGVESLTNFYFDDLELITGPTESEIVASLEDGLTVLRLGEDGVAIERGLTTYVSDSSDKPFETYSRIKYVTTMQAFEREGRIANESRTGPIGRAVVNQDTRDAVVAAEQRRLDQFVLRKEIQPGAKVVLSADVAQTDDDEFVAVDWIGKFGRTLEQIRRTVILT